ncbi:leucine-rich repeat receptor-like protein kinase TDR [Nymphaea colorata]|nr:leucine-rich repeat receptor-like protein kinase TDR [Nymphaea colorata]
MLLHATFLHPLLLLFFLTPLALSSTIPTTLFSLLSLKSSLSDPSNALHDWNTTTKAATGATTYPRPPWCSWSGVTCHPRTLQVISLDISRRNLSGTIPREIRLLTQLRHLNLSNNAFEGPLQPAIFRLPSLRTMDINHNNFNATFPPGFEALRSLAYFSAFSNSFTGPLPARLPPFLQHLNLGGSYFTGSIPASYGGYPTLRFIHLAGNVLAGPLPSQLGNLTRLEHLEVGYNDYSGGLPREFGSMASLSYLDVSSANLSGTLPPEISNLTRLNSLFLFKNRFAGDIPPEIARLQFLSVLDLSDNRLSGEIPSGISLLGNLTFLNLMSNRLGGSIPDGVSDLPNLETLLLWNNSLTGWIPQTLGLNGRLTYLDVSSNFLTGPIPDTLCAGQRLYRLILFSNLLTGPIPDSLAHCALLWRFRAEENRLSGEIPEGFGSLRNLTYVDLSRNNFSGRIPDDLSRAPRLQFMNISRNRFETGLPDRIWGFPSLQIFSASYCDLTGGIPQFLDGCQNIYKVELEGNRLAGSIPEDIGSCEKLVTVRFSKNSLSGRIPSELATLPSITEIDLSQNSLSGEIPELFVNCSTLESFNVSYNMLSGRVPSSGPIFQQLHPSSFTGNPGLCGGVLRPCPEPADVSSENPSQQRREKKTAGPLVWILAVAVATGMFALVVGQRVLHRTIVVYGIGRNYKREVRMGPWTMTAFQRLNFTVDAVVQCLNSGENIVGMGSAGTVFRASMPGGEVIAVKKLWGRPCKGRGTKPGGSSGVLSEVEVLGRVRHRNIVRLLGCCSNDDTTLLLYEYMPNGNLDDWLHGKKDGSTSSAPFDHPDDDGDRKKDGSAGPAGDWVTRYKIAVGVAEGIKYLHHDCQPLIVHRDLKPSNILLDADMEARVADFGVAKLLDETDGSMSVIAGSYGYIAPEYAYTLQVDQKSDIYSFGVVLMEIISGRRSVDGEFGDGNSIVDWVREKIRSKEGALEVLDKKAGAECESVREEMLLVLRVALLCTARSPADRPTMRDVVSMLREAKPKRKDVPEGIAGGHGGDGRPVK